MSTKLNPGAFDCYAAAAPDEPMFILLARDPLAPVLVDIWTQLRMLRTSPDLAKLAEAMDCAEAMRKWKFEKEKMGEELRALRGVGEPAPVSVEWQPIRLLELMTFKDGDWIACWSSWNVYNRVMLRYDAHDNVWRDSHDEQPETAGGSKNLADQFTHWWLLTGPGVEKP